VTETQSSPKSSAHMRLRVDPGRCQAHGTCYVIAPEVVKSDEEGYAVPLEQDLSGPLEQKARDAVAYCPEQALSVGEYVGE
jgi:ferredoxin